MNDEGAIVLAALAMMASVAFFGAIGFEVAARIGTVADPFYYGSGVGLFAAYCLGWMVLSERGAE